MEFRGRKREWGDVPGKDRLEPGCEMFDLIIQAHICHTFIKCAK